MFITIIQICQCLACKKEGLWLNLWRTHSAISHNLVTVKEELIFASKPTSKKIMSSVVLEYDLSQVGPVRGRKGMRWVDHYPQERVNIERTAALWEVPGLVWLAPRSLNLNKVRLDGAQVPYQAEDWAKCSETGTRRQSVWEIRQISP